MTLLNTVDLPNGLVAHGLNHMAVYNAAVIKVYAKNPSTNSLTDTGESYTLAGVKAIAISENGIYVVVQTDTNTYLCKGGVVGAALTVKGKFSVTNSGMIVLANPTAGSVQLITDVTTNLTATLTAADRVVCGRTKFVVFNGTRSLVCGYQEVVLVSETHAKKLMFVSHVGSDDFAYFFEDGTIRCKGKTILNTPAIVYRNAGRHVIGSDNEFDYAYIRNAPQSRAVKLRTTDYKPTKVKIIAEGTLTNAYIGFSRLNSLGAPNRFLFPVIPLKTLEANLTEVVRANTPVPLTYPVYNALSDSAFTTSAFGGYSYKSSDAGNTWAQLSATSGYSMGVGFIHKGAYWVQTEPTKWGIYSAQLNGPSQVFTTSPAAGPSFNYDYFDSNANVVVACSNTVANKPNVFISWSFPTFTAYNVGIDNNCKIVYVGMNVFYASTTSGNVVTSKLIYVPVTQGAPTVLKSFAKMYDLITMIGENIVVVDGDKIRALSYTPIPTESAATLAQATAFAAQIETALTVTDTGTRTLGTGAFVSPWKQQKRLVSGWQSGYQVWEFE